MSEEILVVVSKVKDHMKQAGMNTAGNVAEALSRVIRQACDKAIENAKRDGRKTVMDRDVQG